MSESKKLKLNNTDNDTGNTMGSPPKTPSAPAQQLRKPTTHVRLKEIEESSIIGLKDLQFMANQFLHEGKKEANVVIWMVAMVKKCIADNRIKFVDGVVFLKVLFNNILITLNNRPLPPYQPQEILMQNQPSPQQPPPRYPMQHPSPHPQQPPSSTLHQNDVENQLKSYEIEIRIQLDIVYRYILNNVDTKLMADASACLESLMTLLVAESYHPRTGQRHGFNEPRFYAILEAFLSTDVNTPPIIVMFKEYTKNIDVLHFVWKFLPSFVKSHKFTKQTYAHNVLALIRSSNLNDILPKDHRYLCLATPDICKIEAIKININTVWQVILQAMDIVTLNTILHRQLLLALNEVFLDHIDDPLTLTDFLMDSMECGGAISLLSLHGIYVLMQTQNISFPDIYRKLYFMFEPEVFVSKYKARLIYLTDLFLSSTHLPEALVAAFVKRLARLTLHTNPKDILVLLCFIRILVQRHPSLKNLVIAKIPKEVNEDPYIMEESEPMDSGARTSFLWEIDLLKENATPEVNSAARALFALTPIEESELSKNLDRKEFEVFDAITKSVVQKISLNYHTPVGFHLPEFDKFKLRWDLF